MTYPLTAPRGNLADIRHLGTVPIWHPTAPDAASVLGCGRSKAFEMAQTGELPTIRIGKRKLVVPVPALLRMLGADAGDSAGDTRAAGG